MQQIVEIPFKGVTTSPSDYASAEGDLAFTSGLTNVNGNYQPLPTAKSLGTIPNGFKLLYIHETATYFNGIFMKTANKEVFWTALTRNNDNSISIVNKTTSAWTSLGIFNDLKQVVSMGNVLTFITDRPVMNWIWKNDTTSKYIEFTSSDDISPRFYLRGKTVWTNQSTLSTEKIKLKEVEEVDNLNMIEFVDNVNFGLERNHTLYATQATMLVDKQVVTVDSSIAHSNFKTNTALSSSTKYTMECKVTVEYVAELESKQLWLGIKKTESQQVYYINRLTKNSQGKLAAKYYIEIKNLQETQTDFYISFTFVGYTSDKVCPQVTAEGTIKSNKIPTHKVDNDSKQYIISYYNALSESAIRKNGFIHPFMLIYGYEAYDGTIIYASSPILMMPNNNVGISNAMSGSSLNTTDSYYFQLFSVRHNIRMFINSIPQNLINGDVVKKLIIAISTPCQRFNPDSKKAIYIEKISDNNSTTFCSLIDADQHLSNSLTQEDSIGEKKLLDCYANYCTNKISTYMYNFVLPSYEPKEWEKILIDTKSTFRVIKKIPIEELSEGDTDIELEDGVLSSLESQPVFDTTNIIYNKLIANHAIVNNNRLNIYNIKEILFSGWDIAKMHSYIEKDYGYNTWGEEEKIQRPKYASVINAIINQENYQLIVPFGSNNDIPLNWFFCTYKVSSVTIYKRVDIDDVGTRLYKADINLSEHPYLDGYYYLNGNLDGMEFELIRITSSFTEQDYNALITKLGKSTEVKVCYPNKLYQSNVSNPSSYNISNVQYISNGKILAMTTANKPISEGQFGQFPLYVFTTHGVWAMGVNADGTYSAPKPVTRDVCTNVESITQLDSAVVFVTKRGLMLIEGGQSVCLTENIDDSSTISLPLSGLGVTDVNVTINPRKFMQDCSIVYDYPNSRIVCYGNPTNYPYAMVYSLRTKSWSYIKNDIAYSLVAYPDTLVIDTNNVMRDLSSTEVANQTTGVIATRPFKLSDAEYKTINELRVNGVFKYDTSNIILQASNDLINWQNIASANAYNGIYNRAGSAYRFFRLLLKVALAPNHSLSSFSVKFTTKDDGNLMSH